MATAGNTATAARATSTATAATTATAVTTAAGTDAALPSAAAADQAPREEAATLMLPPPSAAGASTHAEQAPALFVVTLAVAMFLAAWGTLHYGFYTHRLLLDTPIYEHYGDATLHGKVPYRDFSVEYPPGALPVFILPSVLAGEGNFGTYTRLFEALM